MSFETEKAAEVRPRFGPKEEAANRPLPLVSFAGRRQHHRQRHETNLSKPPQHKRQGRLKYQTDREGHPERDADRTMNSALDPFLRVSPLDTFAERPEQSERTSGLGQIVRDPKHDQTRHQQIKKPLTQQHHLFSFDLSEPSRVDAPGSGSCFCKALM